jgi:hypothetical protein
MCSRPGRGWWSERGCALLVEGKAHLNRDLPMSNLAILNMSSDLGDLEPPKVSKTFCCFCEGILHSVFDTYG